MAHYDALTELPNRRLFAEHLQNVLKDADEHKYAVALLLMDLDRFKEVNDTLGHQYGDQLLQQVSARLKEQTVSSDMVARLGGDEFALLISATDSVEANLAVERILKVVRQPFQFGAVRFDISASIGIVFYPNQAHSASELMSRADIAMYAAKKGGVGYMFYSKEIDKHSESQLALSGELRDATENGELVLHYQPIISTDTAKITSCEALVRWNHPKHGLLMPDVFIPLAENSGAILPLTLWVLEETARQGKQWLNKGLDCPIAVNLSTLCLHYNELPEKIDAILQRHALPPKSLSLEVTESMVMTDASYAMRVLNRLSDIGISLALDDFGTGYSSLTHLSRLPVQYVKIDKSFVMDMLFNKDDEVIVRSTIDLGHNLNMKVIAEGVADQQVLNALIQFGCDEFQGYHFSAPLPAAEFEVFARTSTWGLHPEKSAPVRKTKSASKPKQKPKQKPKLKLVHSTTKLKTG
jgi:diguanylate cyclase (GGDEF)-like protein